MTNRQLKAANFGRAMNVIVQSTELPTEVRVHCIDPITGIPFEMETYIKKGASDAKYVAGLVKALNTVLLYAVSDSTIDMIAPLCEKALQQLPEDLR